MINYKQQKLWDVSGWFRGSNNALKSSILYHIILVFIIFSIQFPALQYIFTILLFL